ncbi:MAG: GPN-loop GTPase 1 [Marteilia pararefringens]
MTDMMAEEYATIGLVVIGMAGSGKSTFVSSFARYLKDKTGNLPFLVNLDPAVLELDYRPNVDIRKSIDYLKLMEQYNLGPNGAIITGLNLYATSFNEVIKFIKNRKSKTKYVIFDTPGQIEVFNWSASGSVITQSLSSIFPTIIIYIADTSKCTNPTTFMANMTHSCSILYKYQLPFVLAFNKTDQTDAAFALEWMQDFEAYGKALDSVETYISNLNRSLSLVLDTFYENISHVTISAKTSSGYNDLFEKIGNGVIEYHDRIAPYIGKGLSEDSSSEKRPKGIHSSEADETNNLIPSVPTLSEEFDAESEGEEDLELPQFSRVLNEKEVEDRMKNFKI